MPPCRPLEWDTNHFGFNIARLEGSTTDSESLKVALDWCRENRVKCLYFLADFNDFVTTRVVEANGFNLVDMRVTLEKKDDWSVIMPECAGLQVELATTQDSSELQAIGRFYASRFYYDNRFNSQAVDRMYRLWIGKSLYGGADAVLVGKLEGQVAGFVTYKCSTGEIVLVATDDRLSGRGISTHLVSLAAKQLHIAGSESVIVVTQARNCRAQSVYQRCGFTTKSVELWYHKWFDNV